ncbi:MAG: molybdopterin molybdotransferase MoeA [Bdellovibrionota bacterium]
MIRYPDALKIISDAAIGRLLQIESLPLEKCLGRVSAVDVISQCYVPAFDNSAMDGFAINCESKPSRAVVAGYIAAGENINHDPAIAGNQPVAVKIMTGAPVPEFYFNSVIKVEDVLIEGDTIIIPDNILNKTGVGDNIRRKGEDFKPGQIVVRAGTRLGAHHIMALASVGVAEVAVRQPPRVGVLSTGKEIVPHDVPELEPGMVRNSTAPFIMAALSEIGAEARYYGVVEDDPEQFKEIMFRMMDDGADIIITTGAVSMGDHDFVADSLRSIDATVLFHKCAIRPGKPILFALAPKRDDGGQAVVFSMPGNPVSTAVGLRFFLEPYIRSVLGCEDEVPTNAFLKNNVKKPDWLRAFYKARLAMKDGSVVVDILPGQASFMISPMLDSNAWVVLKEDCGEFPPGVLVEVAPLRSGLYD